MFESPLRPHLSAVERNTLRIWGGDGNEGGDGKPAGEVEVKVTAGDGGDGADGDKEQTPEQKALKEAQDKAEKADKDARDAKKRADAAEKSLQDKEREGMEEHQRTEAERDDYKGKYEKLVQFMETSYVDSAILQISAKATKDGKPTYQWHDPAAVRSFLDRDALTLDMDTGKVDGLEAQLKTLAKEKSWLLVPQGDGDDGGDGGRRPPAGPATGSHPNGASRRERVTGDDALRQKYKMPGYASTMSRPQG